MYTKCNELFRMLYKTAGEKKITRLTSSPHFIKDFKGKTIFKMFHIWDIWKLKPSSKRHISSAIVPTCKHKIAMFILIFIILAVVYHAGQGAVQMSPPPNKYFSGALWGLISLKLLPRHSQEQMSGMR